MVFIIGAFNYSLHLELAISDLEKKGIARDAIAGVPLDSWVEERKILDTIHQADGVSSFDAAALTGTFSMLLGAIYGFELYWGPVVWGLIGLITGGILGWLGDIFLTRWRRKDSQKNYQKTANQNQVGQVVLIIECDTAKAVMVQEILWDNLAQGVGKLPG